MNYFAIKHLHITAAVLSILLFAIRAYWSVTGSSKLQLRLFRILPHVVDTVLLVAGVMLAMMIGPEQPWILAKIVAVILYIGVGMVAIKRGKTPAARGVAALIAIAIFFYIVGVALQHNPMSWLS
ncbi:SirB2 family protein [Pollutimonas thiosulfatoxidans]|uniref:Regulator SirB n=1 Tax=Pollutimonas thiosulfatoxidans TaxID=2028345 RepID=A0A410G9B6_9BURK|nr:SirB2 family protein [Pollutimonas thiosulfatoxidans]MBF6615235.1 SirB2 family protein [Candidimonas sp.]NYT43254.1 SirB2 family protein [Alcaligenaceae bacterium]QAA92890.1 regulator SirB [Pollutimonas thiosulfatoxidans]